MADFDMHADTPAAATDMAAGDRFAYDDVSANAGAGGFETIEADDLLNALVLIAASGGPITRVSGATRILDASNVGVNITDNSGVVSVIEAQGTVRLQLSGGSGGTIEMTPGWVVNTSAGSLTAENGAYQLGWVGAKMTSPATNVIQMSNGSGGGATLEFAQIADVPVAQSNCAGLGAEDVTGTAELIAYDEAGNETQLTPHAADAPAGLYDGANAEEVHRTINPYLGTVEFVNLTRLARMVEAIASGNLATVQSLPAAKRQLHVTETIDSYNARTGRQKRKRTWQEVQDAHQARHDAERAVEQARHDEWREKADAYPAELSTWTAARDAHAAAVAKYKSSLAEWVAKPKDERGTYPAKPAPFTDPRPQDPGPEPTVRPVKDIKKPVPKFLADRGVK